MLVLFATLAFIMPDRHRSANELKPSEMIVLLNDPGRFLSCDQVAKFVVYEDTGVQLIDIREPEEYLDENIPGAINIPFKDILNPDWSGYLDDPEKMVILYSKNDILSSEAWMLGTQLGYPRIKIMKGGLELWNELIMESEFTGEHISPSENALFETRYRARGFYTSMNQLPDSLKKVYLSVKRKKEADLVGGCD